MVYFYILLGIHLSLCGLLVLLVLLQQGKGADAGAAFAGSSDTLFGAGGAANVLTKFTTGVAISFMVTSILLIRAYGGISGGNEIFSGSRPKPPVANTSETGNAAPANLPAEGSAATANKAGDSGPVSGSESPKEGTSQ